MPSEVTNGLIRRLIQRDETGLRKYGVSLDRQDLTIEQWLEHQTEELLDGAGYAQSALREIRKLRAKLVELETTIITLSTENENLRAQCGPAGRYGPT